MKRVFVTAAILIVVLSGLAFYAYWNSRQSSLSADELRLKTLNLRAPVIRTLTVQCGSTSDYIQRGHVFVSTRVIEPCLPDGDTFVDLKVTPKQYAQHSRFPTITYDIDKTGKVTDAQILVSSGCRDIDAIAVDAVKKRTFRMPESCTGCRVRTEVSLDY